MRELHMVFAGFLRVVIMYLMWGEGKVVGSEESDEGFSCVSEQWERRDNNGREDEMGWRGAR